MDSDPLIYQKSNTSEYTSPVISPFGKFYLLDKSGNPRMWLGNLATYPTSKIYQKVENRPTVS